MLPWKFVTTTVGAAVNDIALKLASATQALKPIIPKLAQRNLFGRRRSSRLKAESAGMRMVMSPLLD